MPFVKLLIVMPVARVVDNQIVVGSDAPFDLPDFLPDIVFGSFPVEEAEDVALFKLVLPHQHSYKIVGILDGIIQLFPMLVFVNADGKDVVDCLFRVIARRQGF